MKIIKKRTIIIPFIFMASLSGNAYSSGFPIGDIPNLAAGVVANIQKIGKGIAQNEEYMKLIQFARETFKLETDGFNNGAANYAVRQNQAREAVQNKEIEKVFTATPDACNQVALSFSLESSECASTKMGRVKVFRADRNAFFKDDDEAREEMSETLVREIQATYPDMFENDSDSPVGTQNPQVSQEAPAVFALNANALLTSSDALLSLDKEQYDAMTDFISLIVPDYSFRSKPQASFPDQAEADLMLKSTELKRSLVGEVLRSNLSLRTSVTVLSGSERADGTLQPSKLYTINQAIKDASSESALYEIATSDISTPVLLYRQMVLNSARSLGLQLEEFKRDLAFEGVMSTKLAIMINK